MTPSHDNPQPRYTLQEAAAQLHIGPRALFDALRRRRVLGANNVPAPRFKAAGYFVEAEKSYRHPIVGLRFYSRTYVTAAGLDWLQRLLARAETAGGETRSARLVRTVASLDADVERISHSQLAALVDEARAIVATRDAPAERARAG